MPQATVEWDKPSIEAMLVAATKQLFWKELHIIGDPAVTFHGSDPGIREIYRFIEGATVTVRVTNEEAK